MRTKTIVFFIVVLSFIAGALSTNYLTKKQEVVKVIEKESNGISTGVIKCDKEIKVDETGISTAVGKIYNATVTVQNYSGNKIQSTGSGFVYKTDDKYGYVLTNHHVIENSTKVNLIMSNDEIIDGEVLGSDKYLDLAVIRINKKDVIEVAKLGTSENSNVGDTIITVGSPVGYEYRGSVTRGTLSGKNRMVEVSVITANDFIMNVLQIDAAINPGNSGGPLVNINGEVIGINSLKLVQDEVEGMGFAIPMEYAMRYVNYLEEGKKIERPFIGITMVNVSDRYAQYESGLMPNKDVESGVVITSVTPGSGASNAGLKKGDVIITFNKKAVTNAALLKYNLFQAKVGDTINIEYIREGKKYNASVKLTKLEEN